MTDRVIVYPGSGAQDTDLLRLQTYYRRAINALARIAVAPDADGYGVLFNFGVRTIAGYTVTLTDGALIGPLVQEETTPFGSMPASTIGATPIAVNSFFTTLDFTGIGAGVSGQSVNHVIYGMFTQQDTDNQVLYYQNAANPTQVFRGVNNNGLAQPTTRREYVAINIAHGTPAATGTQATPAIPAGAVPMYLVTMNYGDLALIAAQINPHVNAPFWDGVERIWGGNPTGNVPGFQARVNLPPSRCFDFINNIHYTCVTTGDATHAVWAAPPANTGPTGAAGRGITTVGIDATNNLIINFSDGTSGSAGVLPAGPAGPAGSAGPAGTYVGSLLNQNVFVTSGSYTVSASTNKVKIRMCGGGGAGGGSLANNYSGAGGGAGGYLELVVNVANSATLVYTVGQGGSPNVPGYVSGSGGDTAIGLAGGAVYGVAHGGGGGGSVSPDSSGGNGGGFTIGAGIYGVGYGGGMGGDGMDNPVNGQTIFGGQGAGGPWGGGGRAGTVDGTGAGAAPSAQSYGAGGGGAYLGTGRGGSGFSGIVHIEEYH